MRFNISRFLVRLRQFWTRERLVPVLGFTALALFVLNFGVFLQNQFNNSPFNAAYVTGGTFFSKGGDFFPDAHKRHLKHRNYYFQSHDTKPYRWRCKNEKNKRKSYENYFEAKRFNEEAERFQANVERQKAELERLHQEMQRKKLHEWNQELKQLEKSITIKKLDNGRELDVKVIVDGKVIDG